MEEQDPEYIFKYILVGDVAVGKTCLMLQFTSHTFEPVHEFTIGAELGDRTVEIAGKRVKLRVWDTAGSERFRSISRSYYRGAAGALLVFDVTRRETFQGLQRFLADTRSDASPGAVVVLIGNKCDLEQQRQVTYDEAAEFARANDLTYIETSAKTSQNVDDAFLNTAQAIYDKLQAGTLEERFASAQPYTAAGGQNLANSAGNEDGENGSGGGRGRCC